MQIFIAALLIIVKNQPTCPSARIDTIYVMRCSAIKRTTYDICHIMDKSQKHYAKWKKPKYQKAVYWRFHFTWHSEKSKTLGTEDDGFLGAGAGAGEESTVEIDQNIPSLDCGGSYMTMYLSKSANFIQKDEFCFM